MVVFIIRKWYSNIICAIQLFTDNTRTKRISVQPHHQVQHGRSIIGFNHSGIFVGGQNLFCKIERAVVSLFEGKTWIWIQLFKTNGLFFCQWMILPQINISLTINQMMELQPSRAEQLLDGFPVKITQIQHTDLTSHGTDVTDHIPGFGLTNSELILRHIIALYHIHKCFHCKRIMLGGYSELLFIRAAFPIFFHNRLILSIDFFGMKQEFCTVIGQRHTFSTAVKNCNPQFFFQFFHCTGQRRL